MTDNQAREHISDAVRAFTLNYGDTNAHLALAREADPTCVMADIMGAWLLALSNERTQVTRAREVISSIGKEKLGEREANHLRALEFVVEGKWPSAVTVLERHLMNDSHDLVGHQCAMRLDGYLGRFHRTAMRCERALPQWSKDEPNYGIMLSFYGFGLEERGDFAQAEAISREAAELEPYGYWPHHAVSHVLEMTARPEQGVAWMEEREVYWTAPEFNNRVHIWWHKALYHIDLGELDIALSLYDDEIWTAMRPVGTQLCNATALLWRLETLGCEAGERWGRQLELWQQQLNGMISPFNEIHAAMAALRADDRQAYDGLIAGMKQSAANKPELAPAYTNVALPVSEAMGAFVDGEYARAVDGFLAAEAELWRMGGSIAQRDLVRWTLTEASIRGGQRDAALALTHERLAAKPKSFVNQHFLGQAVGL